MPFHPSDMSKFPNMLNDFDNEENFEINPNQLRWNPIPFIDYNDEKK